MMASSAINRWFRFFIGSLALMIFVFVLVPRLTGLEAVGAVISSSKANDIDASALFYSETGLAVESENFFLQSIEKTDD